MGGGKQSEKTGPPLNLLWTMRQNRLARTVSVTGLRHGIRVERRTKELLVAEGKL